MNIRHITADDLQHLINHESYPAISMFVENTVQWPNIKENRLRLKNLIKEAQSSISQDRSTNEAKALFEPIQHMIDPEQDELWREISGNLAIYLSDSETHIFQVSDNLKTSLHVGKFFDIRPLVPLLNYQNFHLLTVSQENICLKHVSKNGWDKVDLENLPTSFSAFNRSDRGGKTLQSHTAEKTRTSTVAQFHGHGGGKDSSSQKLEEFAKKIAGCVQKHINSHKAPLMVVGLSPLATRVCNKLNQRDVALLIERDPTATSENEFVNLMRTEFEKDHSYENFENVRNILSASKKPGNFIDNPELTVEKARQGLVKKLFIKKMDYVWGEPQSDLESNTTTEDLLNAASIYTLRNGGTVHIIDPDKVSFQSHSCAQLYGDLAV